MKRQKTSSDADYLNGTVGRRRKGKKAKPENSESYDFDYEFDHYDADEWEDSFDNYKFQ